MSIRAFATADCGRWCAFWGPGDQALDICGGGGAGAGDSRAVGCDGAAGAVAVIRAPRYARAMIRRILSAAIVMTWTTLAMAQGVPATQTTAHETPEQFAQRTAWWRQARFGMFIHWGV